MPYCSSCGNQVGGRDIYCSGCGSPQPVPVAQRPAAAPPPPAPPLPTTDPFQNISPRTAGILCYLPVVGWVASVVVLAAHRFRQNGAVRFHAFQGLYLFAAWLLVDWAVRPVFQGMGRHFFRVDVLLEALIVGASIFMIVKASHEEVYSLPVIGDLAHRSATEN